VSAIALLAWLSRAVDNVYWLTARAPRHSPREAIGWWFVPFANLVVPYRIVNETAEDMGAPSSTKNLIIAWALLYVGTGFATRLITATPPDTIPELRSLTVWLVVLVVLQVVAGCLLLVVVERVERAAQRLARGEAVSAPQAAPAQPVAPSWAGDGAPVSPAPGDPVDPHTPDVDARVLEQVVASPGGPAAPPPPPAAR
jgi:hypothetical protein